MHAVQAPLPNIREMAQPPKKQGSNQNEHGPNTSIAHLCIVRVSSDGFEALQLIAVMQKFRPFSAAKDRSAVNPGARIIVHSSPRTLSLMVGSGRSGEKVQLANARRSAAVTTDPRSTQTDHAPDRPVTSRVGSSYAPRAAFQARNAGDSCPRCRRNRPNPVPLAALTRLRGPRVGVPAPQNRAAGAGPVAKASFLRCRRSKWVKRQGAVFGARWR